MFPIFGTANGANRGSLLDETGILSCLAMIAPPEYKVCNSPGWKTRARLNGAGVPSGRMQSVVVERAGGRKKRIPAAPFFYCKFSEKKGHRMVMKMRRVREGA